MLNTYLVGFRPEDPAFHKDGTQVQFWIGNRHTREILRRPIGRTVVDDDHVEAVRRPERVERRLQGRHQLRFAAARHHNDRQVVGRETQRFLHGSPAIPALYAAESGYKIINEIGVNAIREKSMRQTQYLIKLAGEAGFQVTSPKDPAQRGGTITVWDRNAAAITKELIRREFIVDYRPGAGVRISPHFYTKDEELELIVAEMKTIRDTRAFAAAEKVGAAF